MFNNNTYSNSVDDFYLHPSRGFDEGFQHQHQEMMSRRNRVSLYDVENKDLNVYNRSGGGGGGGTGHEFCPSCMSKPPDKQVMFPVYEEPLPPYLQTQVPNTQKSSSPIAPFGNEEQSPLEMVEKENPNVQHYNPQRYMYNNEPSVYYEGYERERYGSGVTHFVDRESDRMNQYYSQIVNNSNPNRVRAMVMTEQNNLYRGSTSSHSRSSFEYPRYYRRQPYDKEQLKNDLEELNKDNMEWKNIEPNLESESNLNEIDTNENNYEGLMDIKKTIKKDYNKKKWRKMTQELFNQILDFEKKNPNIKQCEIEKIFLVNRSTYWRWKKRLLS